MPVDLEMLLPVSPPLYAYSAFVDDHYHRFASDDYSPNKNYDMLYPFDKTSLINEHQLRPQLQYADNKCSFEREKFTSSTVEDICGSCTNDKFQHCSQRERKLKEKKRVSFADDKGLALVEIRSIPDTPNYASKWARDIFSLVSSGVKPKVDFPTKTKWKLAFPNPPHNAKFLTENLRSNFVVLESASMEKGFLGERVIGTIKVKNTDYETKVFLRITCDRWASYEDVEAIYTGTCSLSEKDISVSGNSCDIFTFSFAITLSAMRYEVIEFCVCCRVNDQEFWDNNGGINYRVITTGCAKPHETITQIPRILPDNKQQLSPQFPSVKEQFKGCSETASWELFLMSSHTGEIFFNGFH